MLESCTSAAPGTQASFNCRNARHHLSCAGGKWGHECFEPQDIEAIVQATQMTLHCLRSDAHAAAQDSEGQTRDTVQTKRGQSSGALLSILRFVIPHAWWIWYAGVGECFVEDTKSGYRAGYRGFPQ